MVQKIFDYGRTKNNVRIAETNEQIAAVAYEAAVKKALGEVRDALNNRKNAKLTLNQVKELLHSQEKIYKLAKDPFEEGYTGHLELLDAQRNLLSVRLQDIAANLSLIDSVVDVYKAFGGGFKAEKQKEIYKERGGKLRQKVKLFGPTSAAKRLIYVHDRVDES